MQVSYTLEAEDVAQAIRRNTPASYWRRWAFSFIALAVLGWYGAYTLMHLPPSERFSAFFSVTAPFWIVGTIYCSAALWHFFSVRRTVQTIPGIVGTRTIRLSQESLMVQDSEGQRAFPWDRIEGVDQDARSIYITPKDSLVLIVPKRSFPGEQEAQAFFDQARTYQSASAQTPTVG